MPNKTPIDAQTLVRKITISATLETDIKDECDIMAAAGYLLASSVALKDAVVLIFQLTR